MAPSLWYFDDKFLSPAFSKATVTKVSSIVREMKLAAKAKAEASQSSKRRTKLPGLRTLIHTCLGCLLAYLSLPILVNLASSSQAMNRSFDPFRIVNTYGAFGR